MTFRTEKIGNATLILGDCREVLPTLGKVDAVVTDPPYPNAAGHFIEGIEAALEVMQSFDCGHWLSFWTEIEVPPIPLPLVAVHVWHRTNTNRPDNYEPIFEFRRGGGKRASRVLPHCVIFPGLTGIVASGHPTEKNVALMSDLVRQTSGIVLDPFMGSGTTGVACAKLGREFVGIEVNEAYFDISRRRVEEAYKQADLFIPAPAPRPTQQELLEALS
jgi:site-specific DNA-methyltransferase (adenine-specific)